MTGPITVLVNASSGRASEEGADAIEAGLRAVVPSGAEARFVVADVPALLENARGVADGTIVTVGGDGTISAVAGVLAGRQGAPCFVPLPYGTANLIPRDLGLPLDPVEALRAGLSAPRRRIDVGSANGGALLHSAVFGTFAEIAEVREKARDAEDLGERLAAFGAAAGALLGSAAHRYHLEIDGQPLDAQTNTVFVTVGEITGGERGVPHRASLDSGRLAVYVSDSIGPFGFLKRLIEAGTGGFDQSDGIARYLCAHVTVSADAPLAYSRDGELEEGADQAVFDIRPRALTVPDLR